MLLLLSSLLLLSLLLLLLGLFRESRMETYEVLIVKGAVYPKFSEMVILKLRCEISFPKFFS